MSSRTTSKPQERGGNRFGGIQGLFRDTMTEIRKVAWPDQQTSRSLTLLVIGMACVLGALLGGIDALFVRIWEWIP